MAHPMPDDDTLALDDASLVARAGLEPLPPAEGLFREDGWLRRVAREPSVLFGGVRALLLEVAHPLVAAGVAQHSDFRRDPLGRLQRTLAAVNAITFEPRDRALAAARGVVRAHDRVRGRLGAAVGRHPAGTPYRARDPELVLWVWGTLVDSALAVYRDFAEPLDAAALAEYHRDQRGLALLLGADPARVPGDAASFRRWFDGVLDGEALCVGEDARAIAASVLRTPGAEAGPVSAITAALLPPRLREAFGLGWDAAAGRRYAALRASVRALRSPAAGAGRRVPGDGPPEERGTLDGPARDR